MKIKVNLYDRNDGYTKVYKGILIDKNIIVDENNKLPNFSNKYINFISDISDIYGIHANKRFNTRLTYPFNNGESDMNNKHHVYCYLTFIQKIKLLFIERKTWFHTQKIAAWTIVFNTVFAIFNLYFAISNYQNRQMDVESGYLKLIDKQLESEKKLIDQLQQQSAKLNYQLTLIDNLRNKDTLKSKEKNAP